VGGVTAAAICGAAVVCYQLFPRPLPDAELMERNKQMSAEKPPAIPRRALTRGKAAPMTNLMLDVVDFTDTPANLLLCRTGSTRTSARPHR